MCGGDVYSFNDVIEETDSTARGSIHVQSK